MRKAVITGVLLLLPLLITFWLVKWIILLITDPFMGFAEEILQKTMPGHVQPWLPILSFSLPIVILVTLFFFTCFLGMLGRSYFLKYPLKLIDRLFSTTPFIRRMYLLFADLFKNTLGPASKKAFQNPVVVPFPSKEGKYALGFLTSHKPILANGKSLFPVIVPTAPHPVSGYTLLFSEEDLCCVDISTEDAIRFSVSVGTLVKESDWRLKKK